MGAKDTVLESLPFLLLNDLFPINNEEKVKELYSRVDKMGELAAKAQAEVSFNAGVKEGVRMFAWWKDGEQYVGTCGTTLKKALEEIDGKLEWGI